MALLTPVGLTISAVRRQIRSGRGVIVVLDWRGVTRMSLLEQALADYTGTLLLVTHDRRMLDAVAVTRRLAVSGGRVTGG